MEQLVVADDMPVKVVTREEEIAARELIDQRLKIEDPKKYAKELRRTESLEVAAKRLELTNFIVDALKKRDRDENSIIAFCQLDRTISQLNKLVRHITRSDNGEIKDAKKAFPTKEQFEVWSRKEKTLVTLGEIKTPTLCGWVADQVVSVMRPYVMSHTKRYQTNRTNIDECIQNGSIGVLKAMSTDAGISAFKNHAWKHVQTNVRRPAATSGIIKEPEKTPSITEVRHEITAWLTGWWVEYEMERLLNVQGMKSFKGKEVAKEIKVLLTKKLDFEAVGYDSPYRESNISAYGRDKEKWDKDVLNKIDLEAWISSHNLTEVGAAMWRMSDGSKIPIQVIKEFRRAAEQHIKNINIESFVAEKDMELCYVQKTGITWGMEHFVNQSYSLDRLPLDKQVELADFLNRKYRLITQPERLSDEHDVCYKYPLVLPNQEKFKTVCDVVRFIASSPDFHGNPVSLDQEVDDGCTLKETIGALDGTLSFLIIGSDLTQAQKLQTLVDAIAPRLDLTKEQRGVMEYLFGLNSKPVYSGAFLAENFGKLLAIDDPARQKVSRQRITQYQETIIRRIVEELFKYRFYERENPQSSIELAIRLSEMSKEDGIIATNYFSMVENVASLTWMVEHLHELIPMFAQIGQSARREFLKERIYKIKSRMLKDIYW